MSKNFHFIFLLLISFAVSGQIIENNNFKVRTDKGLPEHWKLKVSGVKAPCPVGYEIGDISLNPEGAKSEVFLIQPNIKLKPGTYILSYEVSSTKVANERIFIQWQENGKIRTSGGNWKKVTANWTNCSVKFTYSANARAPYLVVNATGTGPVSFRNLQITKFQQAQSFLSKASLNSKYGIYAPGEKVVLCLAESPAPASVSVKVTDWDGKTILAQTVNTAKTRQISLPDLQNGYYEMLINDPESGERKLTFAVIPEIDNKLNRENNPFGGMVIPHSNYPLADRERDAEMMKRIGMRWVRTHRLNWIHVQKSPDAPFDWSNADAEVEIYKNNNLDIVATCGWQTPSWASSGYNKPGTNRGTQELMMPAQEYYPQFKKFYKELGARYKGKISYYEVGNEMDAFNFWLGSYENYKKNNKLEIVRDYVNLFNMLAEAVRQSDPAAMIGPNATGAMPEGHTYRPWVENLYKLGIGKNMNMFSTHYMADMDKIREVMRKHGKEVDIIFTEIGGLIQNKNTQGMTEKDKIKTIMRQTIAQYTVQFSKGGKAMCKFLFRDIPALGPNPPWFAGLLKRDFTIRANYVGFATMIRMLAGATFNRELNITHDASSGWLQGFCFKNKNKYVNVIWLNDAASSKISLRSSDRELTVVDMMGREKSVPVKNGSVTLDIIEPVFIIGRITDKPGKVEYPKPRLVKTIRPMMTNGGFEKPFSKDGSIPEWKFFTDELSASGKVQKGFNVTLDKEDRSEGGQSLCLSAKEMTGWWGAMLVVDNKYIPKLKPGQFVRIVVSADVKGEKLDGIGAGMVLSQRACDFKRLEWKDFFFERGTFDWIHKKFNFEIKHFHPKTDILTLELYIGKTTGKVWFDNINLEIQLWQKSIGDIAREN